MSSFATPAALRDSLEQRLLTQARQTGSNLERLRRRAVFERILVRLEREEPGCWILKGGMALELRLPDRARTTKDLDLALRVDGDDGLAVRQRLDDALATDADADGFEFAVAEPTSLAEVDEGEAGWRYAVDVRLAGRRFARVKLDVVPRFAEVKATERIALPGMLAFANIPSVDVEVVQRSQQFAEKLHALTRDYGAPNSRVRDLVDLVLLIDDGLEPDHELRTVVAHVFDTRDTHAVPVDIPGPPAAWEADFPHRAADAEISVASCGEAMSLVRTFWAQVPA